VTDPRRQPTKEHSLTELVRVNVLVAERSGLSRRGADAAIAAARVTSAGRTVLLGERMEPDSRLELDGKALAARSKAPADLRDPLSGAEVLAWHKPWGVTTTHADPHAEITLPQALTPSLGESRAGRMLSIGRLDRESEGLLLLTPERRLVSPLAHPRAGILRGYAVMTDLPLGTEERQRLRAGIRLTDGWARALDAREIRPDDLLPEEVLDDGSDPTQWSYIALGEGRHHEVRRLYGAIGRPVRRLMRISFGPVHLARLPVGESRPLEHSERVELGNILLASVTRAAAIS
jgi:23S rRNA pseudouridine2605 synthase